MEKNMLSRGSLRELLFVVIVGVVFTLTLKNSKKSSSFSISHICANFPYQERWAVSPSIEDSALLHEIVSQKFSYLGSGAQMIAFVSEDQKYVLKFFKMKHLVPKKWLSYLPLPGLSRYRFKKVNQREKRLDEIFTSFQTTYQNYKSDAGLVFVHLNHTKELKKQITLIDKQKKEWRLDLDHVPFIIQEKADMFYPYVEAAIQRGDLTTAQDAFKALLNFVASRCQKGFKDHDKGISGNYGFVGDRVIQIDIGQVIQDDQIQTPAETHKEVERVKNKLINWSQEHKLDPKLAKLS